MKTQFNHLEKSRCVEWKIGERALMEYHYQPETPLSECRRPYFHPLRTLDGDVVTNFRPVDHPWHQGLSMTLTKVDEFNFWGGGTYTKETGYREIDNVGRQEHKEWVFLREEAEGWTGRQRLDWIAPGEELLLKEARSISAVIWEDLGAWGLTVETELANISGRALTLGTYESDNELKGSHYTGLFTRVRAGFLEKSTAEIVGPGGVAGEAMHGRIAPWMMLCGEFSDSSKQASLLLMHDEAHSDYPVRWFIRKGMPCAAFGFVKDRSIILPANDALHLKHHLVIANGHWSERDVESHFPLLQKSWSKGR